MKRLLIAFGLSLAMISAVFADDSDKKTVEIKISEAILLQKALIAATSGHDKIVGQNTSSPTIAHNQLYDIDNNARWALNDDIQVLTAGLTSVDKTIQEMRAKVIASNQGMPVPDKVEDQTPAQKILVQKFTEDYAALMNQTIPLQPLKHVKRADFKEPLPSEFLVPMQQAGIIDP